VLARDVTLRPRDGLLLGFWRVPGARIMYASRVFPPILQEALGRLTSLALVQ
jgi:hypothetical protein